MNPVASKWKAGLQIIARARFSQVQRFRDQCRRGAEDDRGGCGAVLQAWKQLSGGGEGGEVTGEEEEGKEVSGEESRLLRPLRPELRRICQDMLHYRIVLQYTVSYSSMR